MRDSGDDPGAILTGESDGEVIDPECQIAGCDRPGVVGTTVSSPEGKDRPREEYVCLYHHRLLLAMKLVIATAAVAVLGLAIYASV